MRWFKKNRISRPNLSDNLITLPTTEVAFARYHPQWFMKTFLRWTAQVVDMMFLADFLQYTFCVMRATKEILLGIFAHLGI